MDPSYIITVLQVSLFILIFFFASIYSISILLIRRFRRHYNIFILNICFAVNATCIYFIVYFTMFYFDLARLFALNTCTLLLYAYNIASIGIQFSFINISVHRLCSVTYYTKAFIKTKRWAVICSTIQWLIVVVISLPFVFRRERVSTPFNSFDIDLQTP